MQIVKGKRQDDRENKKMWLDITIRKKTYHNGY